MEFSVDLRGSFTGGLLLICFRLVVCFMIYVGLPHLCSWLRWVGFKLVKFMLGTLHIRLRHFEVSFLCFRELYGSCTRFIKVT